MIINIYSPADPAEKIKGFTIVVDVFRAFSTSYFIDENRPDKYIITDSIDHAFELKERYPSVLLIGERQGVKIPGFDYGNSPTELRARDFSGHHVVHTTTAGTKGLMVQLPQNEVVVGSFVNVFALENYIKARKIASVNIYCTAPKGDLYGEEDYFFADYLKSRLIGKSPRFDDIVFQLREGSGQYFVREEFAAYSDFLYCMDIGKFDNILRRKLVDEKFHSVELKRLRSTSKIID